MNDFFFPHTCAKSCYWITFVCNKNSLIYVVSRKMWMNQQRKKHVSKANEPSAINSTLLLKNTLGFSKVKKLMQSIWFSNLSRHSHMWRKVGVKFWFSDVEYVIKKQNIWPNYDTADILSSTVIVRTPPFTKGVFKFSKFYQKGGLKIFP